MKVYTSVAFVFLSTSFVFAQTSKIENKIYRLGGTVGIALAKFAVANKRTEDYPTLECRIGGSISRPIKKKIPHSDRHKPVL